MGKQTRFYASANDVSQLVKEVRGWGGIFICEDGYELNDYEISMISDEEYCSSRFRYANFYIKLNSSRIDFVYYLEIDRRCINLSLSEVIEFSTCARAPRNSVCYEHGRIWYEPMNTIDRGMRKGESTAIDRLYIQIDIYIKRNYILSEDRFAYIGQDAMEKYHMGVFLPCSLHNPIRVE